MVTGDKQWNPCTMSGGVLMALHGDFPAVGCVTSTFLYKCWSRSRHWTFKNNKSRRSSEMHKTSESQATEQHGAQRAVRPICWDLSMSLISQPHGEKKSDISLQWTLTGLRICAYSNSSIVSYSSVLCLYPLSLLFFLPLHDRLSASSISSLLCIWS